MLLDGKVPKEIASTLTISYDTVLDHQKNLYRKLDVHSIKELFAKYSVKNGTGSPASIDNSAPVKETLDVIASPEKPYVARFYDNAVFNPTSTWQHYIIPPFSHTDHITAGESYILFYSFTSDVDFGMLLVHLVDHTAEADFFTLLCPSARPITNGKANTPYSGSITFLAVKTSSSAKHTASALFIDIQSDAKIPPVFTFTRFDFVKKESKENEPLITPAVFTKVFTYNDNLGSHNSLTEEIEDIRGQYIKTYKISGILLPVAGAHAGLVFFPDSSTHEIMKKMSSFSLTVLGDGNSYEIGVTTTESRTEGGNNHYRKLITPPNNELSTVTVYLNELAQAFHFGKPVPFIQDNVEYFQIDVHSNKEFNLKVWDIKFTQ